MIDGCDSAGRGSVPSSRPILAVNVVRPPTASEGLVHRRPCTATHKRAGVAVLPDKIVHASPTGGHRFPSPNRPSSHGPQNPTLHMLPAHLRHEDHFADDVRAAAKDVAVPDIATWPAQGSSSRLLDVLTRRAQAMDKETNPILRAEHLIKSIQFLGEELKSFRPLFSVYATELQVLVGRLASSQEECTSLQATIVSSTAEWEGRLRDKHIAYSHEIRALSQELEDNKDKMKQVQEDGDRLRRKHADVERDRKALQSKEQEFAQFRRIQEQSALQFAQHNQALQERIPPLEEEARLQRQQAESLRRSNQSIAHRSSTREKELTRVIQQLEDKIKRQQESVDEANGHNRRLAASLNALRSVKDAMASDLAAARDEVSRMQVMYDEKLRGMTPRPDFDAFPAELVGSAKCTSAAKVDTVVGKLQMVTRDLAIIERCSAPAVAAFTWVQKAESAVATSVLQMPQAEVSLVPPACSDDDEPVPDRWPPGTVTAVLDWPLGVSKVLCKAVTLVDMTMRARELMDHCSNMQSRTSRHVELSMSMLAFFLEGVALGDSTAAQGQYPAIPSSCRIPMSVYEHCMNVVRASQYFAVEPTLRTFGHIFREELGPWIWPLHKKTIHDVMLALTAEDQLPATTALSIIQSELDEWPSSVVLAVQRAVMQSVIASGGTLVAPGRPEQRRMSCATRTPMEALKVRIVWDRDAVLEPPLMRRLRVIFLEATLAFYQRLEKRLLSELHAGKPPHLYEFCCHTTVDAAVVLRVVQAVSPSLTELQATTFVADVFDLALSTAKQEALCAKSNAFDYMGPSSGPAASQLFLPGRMEHFYGSLRPYPQLITTRILANRKTQTQRRRGTLPAARKSVASVSPAPQVPTVQRRADDAPLRPQVAKSKSEPIPLVALLRFIRKVQLPPLFAKGLDASKEDDHADFAVETDGEVA